jgi:hypothetical protein
MRETAEGGGGGGARKARKKSLSCVGEEGVTMMVGGAFSSKDVGRERSTWRYSQVSQGLLHDDPSCNLRELKCH